MPPSYTNVLDWLTTQRAEVIERLITDLGQAWAVTPVIPVGMADVPENLSETCVIELTKVAPSHKIQAIKDFRHLVGVHLAEAKSAVESVIAGASVSTSIIGPPAALERKLLAIRRYPEITWNIKSL